MKRERRTRNEWMKAGIAFIVFLISIASADSEMYIIPAVTAIISILYLNVLSVRLKKRGAY